MNSDLQDRIRQVVTDGLSADPLVHAEQVAEIVSLLHEAFGLAGLRSTVVGGSAIELHAPGLYVTGDIDLVVERIRHDAGRVETVFESLRFQRRGRHWILGDLFVEVPSNVLLDPSETMRVGNSVFEIVTKEVVLADRIVGFRQWQVIAWGQQAIDLIAAFEEDLDWDWLRRKLAREGSLDALKPLKKMALGQGPITAEVLVDLLEELRGGPPGGQGGSSA
jgi:hypothetical protein